MTDNFIGSLKNLWTSHNSLLCVGLDPNLSLLPPHLSERDDAVFEFCTAIIDATHDLVCAYKPQIAYFADTAKEEQLRAVIEYVKNKYPHIPIILDAKRGDIGSTASMYAHEAFDRFKADAVTINPYMGQDSAQPFLDRADKGVVVLCRTSNAGGAEFQDLLVGGAPLYERVARNVFEHWNKNDNCALVVGATNPKQMERVRSLVGDMPFLVPGVGAQGGDVAALLKAGLTEAKSGLVINSSRGIIFSSVEEDYAQKAREAAIALRDEINLYR
ncbi:MAG: orotidine-5'-phosphate decarboxylase [Arenicella sp.]|jgi:orotidine-5'-phosphate decarboxylase|nr:orotidine-5'-phosphate decarboxylase [Arenicella sp.]HAU68606.1 orotidine-5'-phosphate decarboxylase [Gammaproteobacteria bacterium]